MEQFSWLSWAFDKHVINSLLAGAMGFTIGMERAFRDKGAGIRTHSLVAMGSAFFTSVYLEGMILFPDDKIGLPPIVSAIGFLGAGAILKEQNRIVGLTTAATIWVTSGIGMICGLGLHFVAAKWTVIVLLFMFLSRDFVDWFRPKRKRWVLKAQTTLAEEEHQALNGVIALLKARKLDIKSISHLQEPDKHGFEIEFRSLGVFEISSFTEAVFAAVGEIDLSVKERTN